MLAKCRRPVAGRNLTGIKRWHPYLADERVRAGRAVLGCAEKDFMQLLALSEAGEVDLDVLTRFGDEALRDVDDLDRLTHVEHQHVARFADGAGGAAGELGQVAGLLPAPLGLVAHEEPGPLGKLQELHDHPLG